MFGELSNFKQIFEKLIGQCVNYKNQSVYKMHQRRQLWALAALPVNPLSCSWRPRNRPFQNSSFSSLGIILFPGFIPMDSHKLFSDQTQVNGENAWGCFGEGLPDLTVWEGHR